MADPEKASLGQRIENWAGRLVKVKERKLVILLASLLAGVVLVGTAWEKSKPFLRLFKRASDDAGEIAKIRKQVEQQRETIAAVARDANSAREEMNKALTLSTEAKEMSDRVRQQTAQMAELVDQATKNVETMRTTAEFTFVLARVAADDRRALDELVGILNQPTHDFYNETVSAVVRLTGEFETAFQSRLNWEKLGLDPNKVDFEEMRGVFQTSRPYEQAAIINEMAKQDRFSKYDRLTFFRDVIKSTPSIAVLNAACKAMNQEAKIDRNILGYQLYLDWWMAQIRDYTCAGDLFLADFLERESSLDWSEIRVAPAGASEQVADWSDIHVLPR